MNDFTKDELEIILGAFEWISQDPAYREPDGWDKPVQTKIQSMIDNYCEHTPLDAHYEQFRWQLCSKCGVQYK